MRRQIISIIGLLLTTTLIQAMDFGLRFRSQKFTPDKRTSIILGEKPYDINEEFQLGFFYSFYADRMFGNIVTLTTDDGQRVSVVASLVEEEGFRIALVVNDNINHLENPITVGGPNEDHITITLDKANNTVRLQLNGSLIECPIDLSKSKTISPRFGLDEKMSQPDVAPIELRNARIFINGVNTNHWDFKYHDTPYTSPDDIGGVIAHVSNPHWLLDDHTDWKQIYSKDTKDRIQTTFDPKNERFLIVGTDEMTEYYPVRKDSTVIPIKGGHRIMGYSNHLVYSPKLNSLINYNLNKKNSVKMDLESMKWTDSPLLENEEANYSNHATAIAGDTLYAFGGYGFYKYHNDLFTIDLNTGEITEHRLSPALMPMTSATAAVVDGKLYIFGGKGNETGQQELPSPHQYALYEYDINTWKGRKVWELDAPEHDFLPSQTMHYDKKEDRFYFAATSHGGELFSISRTQPKLQVLSTGIHSKMDFHDFVFDLYRSEDGRRLYLVIDKRLDPVRHELRIYRISSPFLTDEYVINNKIPAKERQSKTSQSESKWLWWLIPLLALPIGAIFIFFRRKKKSTETPLYITDTPSHVISKPQSDPVIEGSTDQSRPEPELDNTPVPVHSESGSQSTAEAQAVADEVPEEEDFSFIALTGQKSEAQNFDRSKASISFLGGFCVRNKDGNDITVKFTARIKHLLIMLLLSSIRYESGIKYQMIDEEIWKDKDEKAAQNNRNVSLRKLRLLLEEVGNVEISYDKGFFKIHTNDVLFDYKELKRRIDDIEGSDTVSPEMVDELLELLLMGPMLPNTTYDWLDQYKADFSNSALEILTKLLKYELGKDDNLAYRIAETVSLHDTLNEDALIAKCAILSRRRMHGLAKNIYTKFCREYEKSMGEEFSVSFSDACKGIA